MPAKPTATVIGRAQEEGAGNVRPDGVWRAATERVVSCRSPSIRPARAKNSPQNTENAS